MSSEYIAWIGFAGSVIGALLAGIIALVVMFCTTRQTRKIQQENKKDAVKPVLIFQQINLNKMFPKFQGGVGSGVEFRNLYNVGNGCAINIEIECDLNIDNKLSKTKYPNTLSNNNNCAIALVSKEIYDLNKNDEFSIEIKYTDIYKNLYKSEYTFECGENDTFEIISFKFS